MNYLLESNIVFPSRTSPLFITLFSYQLKDNMNIKNMTLKKRSTFGMPWSSMVVAVVVAAAVGGGLLN
jgi:hypothetical protein